jgi:hypothetical protein
MVVVPELKLILVLRVGELLLQAQLTPNVSHVLLVHLLPSLPPVHALHGHLQCPHAQVPVGRALPLLMPHAMLVVESLVSKTDLMLLHVDLVLLTDPRIAQISLTLPLLALERCLMVPLHVSLPVLPLLIPPAQPVLELLPGELPTALQIALLQRLAVRLLLVAQQLVLMQLPLLLLLTELVPYVLMVSGLPLTMLTVLLIPSQPVVQLLLLLMLVHVPLMLLQTPQMPNVLIVEVVGGLQMEPHVRPSSHYAVLLNVPANRLLLDLLLRSLVS